MVKRKNVIYFYISFKNKILLGQSFSHRLANYPPRVSFNANVSLFKDDKGNKNRDDLQICFSE